MNDRINCENGIAYRGNWNRLKELMERSRKMQCGTKIVLGFIGGSITQGSCATAPELCYAYRVYEWWQKKFPGVQVEYCNAGIGGTTSQFGVARVQEDLLDKKTDFVITEFSVNDESNAHFMETYEGLVRRIYSSESQPAIIAVCNVFYHNGANAQLVHEKIARHYGIPCVSMQSSVYPELLAGRIENREITADDLHPNDKGHAIVASVITYFLDKVYESLDESEELFFFPKPLSANTYESSVRHRSFDTAAVMKGFISQPDGSWSAHRKGDFIEFNLEGSGVAVQYIKSVQKPAPVAKVIIDGDAENAMVLDANFMETWGDKLELETVFDHCDKKNYSVRIEIVEAEECVVPFRLLSVITAGEMNV